MKKLYYLTLLLLIGLITKSQEKPPVITDDYVTILAGDTIHINVMANDWCMEGHNMEIINIWHGEGGTAILSDSLIIYSSFFVFHGVDTIRYLLLDLNNNLMSDIGNLVITTENYGSDNLDINNIDASLFSYGYQFCEIPNHSPRFTVPKGGNIHSIFSYSLWLGGKGLNEEFHVAGERFRILGEDYFPGPVSETYLNSQYQDWNKVWKISRDEINFHNQNWWKPDYEPIPIIKDWPASGDTSLGQANNLAPFNDYNNDGIYNPFHGDSPFILGDQSIWLVYNDDMDEHDESEGWKLGFEIQLLGYAFDCPYDSIFKNTLFLDYTIINRSDTNYHDLYLGTFFDFDLGNPWDDYVGCDSILNTFFAYNGDNNDEDNSLYGITYGYGYSPPVQGVVYLNQPLSGFIATNNNSSLYFDPTIAEEYYNMLTGHWSDGTHLTYGGSGYGGDIEFHYMYPGNPQNPDEWSEVTAYNNPGDRRGIGSSGPYTLNSGDTLKFEMGLVFARDYDGTNFTAVDLLKERITQLKWFYENDSTPCGTSWSNVPKNLIRENELTIYPNPASTVIHIKSELFVKADYRIFAITGHEIKRGSVTNSGTIEINDLTSGIYFLCLKADSGIKTTRFIKR